MPPDSLPARRAVKRFRSVKASRRSKAPLPLSADHAPQIGVQVQVFLDRQILVEPETLRHVADRLPERGQLGARVGAADREPPFLRQQQPGEEAEQRGLAAAVRANQAGNAATEDMALEAINGRSGISGEPLGYRLGHNQGRPRH